MKTIVLLQLSAEALLLLSGCSSLVDDKKNNIAAKVPETVMKKPQANVTKSSALALEQSGKYLEALKQYSQLADTATGRKAYHRAICGKARCLSKMRKYKLAISVLTPLTANPRNSLEAEKLAMAGELLIHLNKYEEAESALEVAIDSADPDDKNCFYWLAPASANLGKAYLHNGKLRQAEVMFDKAAMRFNALGSIQARDKCHNILKELESM